MQIKTYGCSFTNYFYPTWSDILAQDHKVNCRAWPGCGNERIFYMIMEDFVSGELNQYDMIVVQWTGFYRWDYLTRTGWSKADGAIMHSDENAWIWKRIKSWYNPDYEESKCRNYMVAVEKVLGSIPAKKVYLSYETSGYDFVQQDSLFDTYKGNYVFENVPWSDEPCTDDHPNLLQHLEIASKIANVSDKTKQKVLQLDRSMKINPKWREFEL